MIVSLVLAAVAAWAVVATVATAPDARVVGSIKVRLGVTTAATPLAERVRTNAHRRVDAHRRRRADRTVPDLLDGIVRQLRSGATIRHAVERVADRTDDPEARRLASELRSGASLTSSLGRWRGDRPEPNRRLAAVAVDVAAASGGASARVLDGVAETLRDRVALEREITALSTQSRASAAVLVIAPIGFAVLAISIDPRLVDVLRTPIGIACIVSGLALDAIGAWWMSRLVGRRR